MSSPQRITGAVTSAGQSVKSGYESRVQGASSGRALAGAVGISVSGSFMFVLAPVFVKALRLYLPTLTPSQFGLLAAGDTFGMFTGATVALLLVTRVSWRVLATVSLVTLLIANGFSVLGPSWSALAAARVVAGTAGGMLIALGMASFALVPSPAGGYALYTSLQTALGSIIIWTIGPAEAFGSLKPIFVVTSLIAAALSLGITWLPAGRPRSRTQTPTALISRPVGFATVGVLVVVGIFMWAIGTFAFWSYLGVLGSELGIGVTAVAHALSLSFIGALIGGGIVVLLGSRLGQWLPTMIAMTLLLASCAAIREAHSAGVFLLIAMLFQCSWTIGGCYAFGVATQGQWPETLGIVYLLALKAGFGVAPAVAVWITTTGASALLVVPLSLVCVSVAAAVTSLLVGARQSGLLP